ncbi:MAG TPA: hypothetical protein VLH79_16565 [Chthonomonadales bacterium]|nr:hypothetical protein [Chthonomonadales bacterium]
MTRHLDERDVVGLVRPGVDAHTLGLARVRELLDDCGLRCVLAHAAVCADIDTPDDPRAVERVEAWMRRERVTGLGFSYRLDPAQGAERFGHWVERLRERRLLASQGGPVSRLYFAGLPAACDAVERRFGGLVRVFRGDETDAEALAAMGVPPARAPGTLRAEAAYDEDRLAFGRRLVQSGRHLSAAPPAPPGYAGAGTERDTLTARLADYGPRGALPLMRAHVGPYLPDREAAVRLFLEWCRSLAAAGSLDVLSIGASQLTQSRFGEEWGDAPNGGGVPINSEEEYRAVYAASRPLLVRTYAGTRNIPELARLHERALNIAWHALSFWWFCQIDGRGPLSVRDNLAEHVRALRVIAETGKPFEPNVPHHFAFRGADDVTYVVSGVLAARAARAAGVRTLVLQVMLNTPRQTSGLQDLAKARAMLTLVRELEGRDFRVVLQPRAGLDYLSADEDRARAQLAAVAALMDDIEPHDPLSPAVVHVVSYSEAVRLADPPVIDESVRITRAAIAERRRLRARGDAPDMGRDPEVRERTERVLQDARAVLNAIEGSVPAPETPAGLYTVLAAGFLPVPHLWECRDEFARAVAWRTRFVDGGVRVVDEAGRPIPPAERAAVAAQAAREMVAAGLA